MLKIDNKTMISRITLFLLATFSVIIFNQCNNKKIVKVEKKEYSFGNTFSTDTIKVVANKPDVAWKLSTEAPWIIIDSQIQFGTKDILWSVLDNTDSNFREANLYVVGQDIDTIKLKVLQDKGTPIIYEEEKPTPPTPKKPSKKIIIEDRVEDIAPTTDSSTKTSSETATPKTKKNLKPSTADDIENVVPQDAVPITTKVDTEKPKAKIELSVDEVILGAANNLESTPITIDAVGDWQIKGNIPKWITIIDMKDGKAITKGQGKIIVKLKTLQPNADLNPRNESIEFKLGKISKILKITQKPTEADLSVDKSNLPLSGDIADDDKFQVKVVATNTNWTISDPIPDWIKIQPLNGSVGETIISVNPKTNETNQPRSLKLTLVSTGGTIKKEINITQDIQTVKLKVSNLAEPLGPKTESFSTFTVTSNVEWEIIKKEEVTWYSLDVTNGTGGEDNVETITVTAQEPNNEEDRTDTLIVVAQKQKRKVVITQRGTKVKEVNLTISKDTYDWQADVSDSAILPVIELASNDSWKITDLPEWLTIINPDTKEKILRGTGNARLQLQLLNKKDSIPVLKSQAFNIVAELNPLVRKSVTIKSKSNNIKKEIKVSGLTMGNFLPYLQIGNISAKNADAPPTKTIQVYSSTDFVIQEKSIPNVQSTAESFFKISVNKQPYTLGDVIAAGNHQIEIIPLGDNITENPKSNIKLLGFEIDGELFKFMDNATGVDSTKLIEIKQEPLEIKTEKPTIFMDKLDFNGYNSFVLLGNPTNEKKIKQDTGKSTIEPHTKIVRMRTNKPIKLSLLENKSPFFDISYGSDIKKINNSYKFGKTLPAGEYFFLFEAKKNYTDPNGFKTRQTITLYFEEVIDAKKAKNTEPNAEELPNLTFIDLKNRDFAGSQFRTEFLIEQESL